MQSQSISQLAFYFTEIEMLILNFTREDKGSRIVKTILQKNKAEKLIFLNYKTY